jgi:hypothetical protein
MPRKTKKKKKSMKKHKNKNKIIDPDFSKRIHKGTAASPNSINYHYQKFSHIMEYINAYANTKPALQKKIYLFRYPLDNLLTFDLEDLDGGVHSYAFANHVFHEKIFKASKIYRFIPIVLQIQMLDDEEEDGIDYHANSILIDTKRMTIELFEPHGYRVTLSTLGGVSAAYNKKTRIIQRYFKNIFPKYQFIDAVDMIKKTAYQAEKDPDEHTGYCVMWTLLFIHYRLLNPDIDINLLMKYIDKKITTRFLLRYSSLVEDTLKFKV